MKNPIYLNESQLESLVDKILSEQKVYSNIDKTYDYKLINGVWYAKRKDGQKWVDLSGYPKAIEILNRKTSQIPLIKQDSIKVKQDSTKTDLQKNDIKSDTIVSKTTNPKFISLINAKKLNTTYSVPIFQAGQPECARFVNEFNDKIGHVGNAWLAHNNDTLGERVFSPFYNLNPQQIKKVINLWLKINKNGGGKKNGSYNNEAKELVNSLVPKSLPTQLKLNDVVGIYYPPSENHELAFYEGGLNPGGSNQSYFKDVNGKLTPGDSIKSGKGWGMNTHVGIVGAIKNGVPIVFHNIHGQVFADPYNNLTDNARIAWVRRSGGEPIALNKAKSSINHQSVSEGVNRKKTLLEQKPDNLMPGQTDNPLNTKKIEYKKYDKYSCVTELGFRPIIDKLISEGYDKTFLKASLGVIGRESSFASGLRYNITSPLKVMASFFGSDTSIGPGQMKQSTANDLKLKESITTLRGSLIAVYKYLQRSYKLAIDSGYSTTKPTINFDKGTGNAALDIAIASYNMGIGRIKKYCSTNDPNIKRSCSDAGKVVGTNPKYTVTNQVSPNYLPNYKTERWDGVNISTHGYVEEVSKNIKSFNCF